MEIGQLDQKDGQIMRNPRKQLKRIELARNHTKVDRIEAKLASINAESSLIELNRLQLMFNRA